MTGRRDHEHCFTLTTNADGARLHGFCRQAFGIVGPTKSGGGRGGKSATHGSPPVLCIISEYLWPSVFFKVLQTVEASLKASPLTVHAAGNGSLPSSMPEEWAAASILKHLLSHRLTSSVRSLTLAGTPRGSVPGVQMGRSRGEEVRIPNALAGPQEYADIHPARLLWYVTPRQMVSILAAMLMERRVIFMSATEIGKLPLAVHAAAALLHPFSWRHVYLPLVPQALQDYVTAPMPLLAGVWEQVLVDMQEHDAKLLNSALVVDLDLPGRCIPEVGCIDDDAALLPVEPTEKLISRLDRVKELLSGPGDDRCAVEVYHAVADFLTGLVGPWEKCLVHSHGPNGSSIEFDVEAMKMLQQRRGEDFFVFQESFLHSQMFDHFIQERLVLCSSLAKAGPKTKAQPRQPSLPLEITKPKAEEEEGTTNTKNEESLLDDDLVNNTNELISIEDGIQTRTRTDSRTETQIPTLYPTPTDNSPLKDGMALHQWQDYPTGIESQRNTQTRGQKGPKRSTMDSTDAGEWSLNSGKDDVFRDLVIQATQNMITRQPKP